MKEWAGNWILYVLFFCSLLHSFSQSVYIYIYISFCVYAFVWSEVRNISITFETFVIWKLSPSSDLQAQTRDFIRPTLFIKDWVGHEISLGLSEIKWTLPAQNITTPDEFGIHSCDCIGIRTSSNGIKFMYCLFVLNPWNVKQKVHIPVEFNN